MELGPRHRKTIRIQNLAAEAEQEEQQEERRRRRREAEGEAEATEGERQRPILINDRQQHDENGPNHEEIQNHDQNHDQERDQEEGMRLEQAQEFARLRLLESMTPGGRPNVHISATRGSALSFALQNGQTEAVDFLIKQGAVLHNAGISFVFPFLFLS